MGYSTKFELQQTAEDRSREIQLAYGVYLDEIEDPAGYCFNGEFRIPSPGELFLTRAREVAERTIQMRVSGPRLILIEWSAKRHVSTPISASARELIEEGYRSQLSYSVCAHLANVSTRTVAALYQQIEMKEWRRGKVDGL